MDDYEQECIEAALEVAEELLMHAPMFDGPNRVVPSAQLLRIVQELNACISGSGRQAFNERKGPDNG